MVLRKALLTILLSMTLACGQKAPLVDYTPQTPQERALKSVLLEFQEGVINRDSGKIAPLIHEKASIMVGRDRKLLSKAEYVGILPERLAENSAIALWTPRMTVSGNQAEIKMYMNRGGDDFLMVFHMKLEADRWTIMSWHY